MLPEAQGLGVGGRLFELAATGAPPGAVRATVTDSLQPISNTLYARRGLLPREVLVGFGGEPRADLRAAAARARSSRSRSPSRRSRSCARSTRPASGVDRSVDHEFYLTDGGRRGWLFRRAGRPAAYVDGAPGRLGRAGGAAVRERDMETVTAYGIADLGSRRSAPTKVRAGVTGRCEGAQRAFWEAGLVFDGTPGLLLASRPFGRLDRYVAASYGMF